MSEKGRARKMLSTYLPAAKAEEVVEQLSEEAVSEVLTDMEDSPRTRPAQLECILVRIIRSEGEHVLDCFQTIAAIAGRHRSFVASSLDAIVACYYSMDEDGVPHRRDFVADLSAELDTDIAIVHGRVRGTAVNPGKVLAGGPLFLCDMFVDHLRVLCDLGAGEVREL